MKFVLFYALALSGCASSPSFDAAVSAHNMFRQVIVSADQVLTPIYKAAGERALEANPNDDEAYRAATAPYENFATALITARNAEQVARNALEQCADQDDCDVARVAFACGRDALGALSHAGGQIADTVVVFAAAYVAQLKLAELAGDAKCVGAKP